jgi:acyl-coenzyme A thioesterase PaaI-like protein
LWRLGFNLFPAFRGTGARVEYVAPDMREVRVKLPFGWRTRNVVGTTFGGSMYAALDPFYALMLMQNLGSDYVVWDKAANIRYRRPGRTDLYARFALGEEELREIRNKLDGGGADGRGSVDRVYRVELADAAGEIHAIVEKTLYIANGETRGRAGNAVPMERMEMDKKEDS